MKREHPDPQNLSNPKKLTGSSKRKNTSNASGKMWIDEETAAAAAAAGGMDELLAVLGYKVRSSDMEEVAQKLEQLEMVLGKAEDRINHLSADTVHYNPSDLSGWVQNMLSSLNPPYASPSHQSALYDRDDLLAIPGVAAYPQTTNRSHVPSPSSSSSSPSSSSHPMVVVDSQETGVCLVHALLACAEAVQQDNFKLADALVKRVGSLAASQPGAMRKVATYFAEALARRIYNLFPKETSDFSFLDSLESHFYEACPYLKFAHFTANQAILQSLGTSTRVHVIDFSLKQGMQWPQLMQALAIRPGGPHSFRLTGICPVQPDISDALQEVGWKLNEMANRLGVSFKFRRCSLADIELDLRPSDGEVVAVNSVFDFHRSLSQPGAIEKLLSTVKRLNPKIVTIAEQEANHNGSGFLDRFTEALHYYSSLFDSLEGMRVDASEDVLKSELYLGQQICNVVACEGPERVERHETLEQWRTRLERAGFDAVPLGSDAYRQASMLLAYCEGGGYRVEERNGCLMLGWHTRPLIASSAWRVSR